MLLISASFLPADARWNRAVSIYAKNQDWLPRSMVILTEELNNEDEVQSWELQRLAVFKNSDGEMDSRILSAEKNGEDVTEERRKNPQSGNPMAGAPENEDSDFSSFQKSPFDPEEQPGVSYRRTGKSRWIDGRRTYEYSFEHLHEKDRKTFGSAWLADDSGAPILVAISMEPLPTFVHHLEAKLYYRFDADAEWYMKKMSFEGRGGFLFIRKNIRSTITFSDYIRMP
jgi:hypothetical protein